MAKKKKSGIKAIRNPHKEWIRFIAIFAVVTAPLYLAYFYAQQQDYLAFIKTFTAQLTAKILYLTGVPVRVLMQAPFHGDAFVYGDYMPIRVIYECTGIFTMIIFFAGIMAYRSTVFEKLIGLAIGIPGIYLTNVLRLLVLGLIGHFAPDYFDFFHNYLWYALFSIIVIGLWIYWIDVVVDRRSKK